jgi:hypothetical protein
LPRPEINLLLLRLQGPEVFSSRPRQSVVRFQCQIGARWMLERQQVLICPSAAGLFR